jgi:hypothetical protein
METYIFSTVYFFLTSTSSPTLTAFAVPPLLCSTLVAPASKRYSASVAKSSRMPPPSATSINRWPCGGVLPAFPVHPFPTYTSGCCTCVHSSRSQYLILSLLPCMRSASKKMRGMWKGKLSVTPYADDRSGIYIWWISINSHYCPAIMSSCPTNNLRYVGGTNHRPTSNLWSSTMIHQHIASVANHLGKYFFDIPHKLFFGVTTST